jgi:hypothetical protein
MRDQMPDSSTTSMRKIELNMGVLISFESRKHMFLGSTKHIMDFMDLIQFILARE